MKTMRIKTLKQAWSFRSKLLLSFVFLIISLALGAFFSASKSAEVAAKEKITMDFRHTVQSLNQMIANRVEVLQEMVQASVSDPIFRGQLGRTSQSDADFGLGDSSSNQIDPLNETHQVLASADLVFLKKYPVLSIFNNQGKLLYSKQNLKAFGTNLSELVILKNIKKGIQSAEFNSSEQSDLVNAGILGSENVSKVYLMLGQKLTAGNKVLGYIIAGELLSDALLPELEKMSRAKVGIHLSSGTWAYTEQSSGIIKVEPKLSDSIISYLGKPYLLMSEKMDNFGVGTQLFFMTAIGPDIELFNKTFALGFLSFLIPISLLGLMLSGWIARKMSDPLLQLVMEVQKVTEGNLAAKVAILSNDEIGLLAKSFNEMTESLSATRIDPLTGAYTEQYLTDTLTYEMLYAKTYKRSIALVRIKIDNWDSKIKLQSDEFQAELLQLFVQVLKADFLHIKDVLARVSENEFAILQIDIIDSDVVTWLESFRLEERLKNIKLAGVEMPLSMSLGIAILNPYIVDVAGFIDASKKAVRDALKLGENKSVFSQGSLPKILSKK